MSFLSDIVEPSYTFSTNLFSIIAPKNVPITTPAANTNPCKANRGSEPRISFILHPLAILVPKPKRIPLTSDNRICLTGGSPEILNSLNPNVVRKAPAVIPITRGSSVYDMIFA